MSKITIIGIVVVIALCIAGVWYLGLLDGIVPTVFEPQPYEVSYDISYGYDISCSDGGFYELSYLCDLPSILSGTVGTPIPFYDQNYTSTTHGSNEALKWQIESRSADTYRLGVHCSVTAYTWMIADIHPIGAMLTGDISLFYPSLVNQYTGVQQNETLRFIDPKDPGVIDIVDEVVGPTDKLTAWNVSMDLFGWLKENTVYVSHSTAGAQPAAVTLALKSGDCDDLSYLYLSLCRAAGIPSRLIRGFLITETDGDIQHAVAHAWVEVFVGGTIGNSGWVPVECASISNDVDMQVIQNFGVEDALHLRTYIGDGQDDAVNGSALSYRYVVGVTIVPSAFISSVGSVSEERSLVVMNGVRHFE